LKKQKSKKGVVMTEQTEEKKIDKPVPNNDLQRLIKVEDRLNQLAAEYGLKYCDIEWDIIPDQKMFEIMAYRIPGNISNWKFGRDYERIRTINENMYDGLPYEVVINSDPSRAYLMKNNTFGVQCLVMAHVIGHAAFFTMNKYFEETRKDIIQVMDYAAKRYNEYEKAFGLDELEMIVDAGHALQFHSSPFDIETEENKKKRVFEMRRRKDHNINKGEYADITKNHEDEDKVKQDIQLYNQKLWRAIRQKTPIEPCGDLLRYIIDYSTKLEDWQKDILEILRLEGQYFWPQIKTKYMNEGFATYWHQKLMGQLFKEGFLDTSTHAQYNFSNALVKAQHKLAMNPYLIGCKMWEDIVMRWDKGRHGRDWEDCNNRKERDEWDTKDMKGHEQMFRILRSYQDWFFMQNFLTIDLVEDLNLYIYVGKENPQSFDLIRTNHEADDVRNLIIASFAHSHIPEVNIVNINYEDAGKMFLKHSYAGAELQLEYAKKTLNHIYDLWGREVILETVLQKKPVHIKRMAKKQDVIDLGAKGAGDLPDGGKAAALATMLIPSIYPNKFTPYMVK
jgi:stage V sporulation protein R